MDWLDFEAEILYRGLNTQKYIKAEGNMKKHLSPVVAIFAILTFFAATEVRVEAGDPPQVKVLGSWVPGLTHTKENGPNRALVFIAHAEKGNVAAYGLSGVTYGGQAMKEINDINISGGTTVTRVFVAAYVLNDANIEAATSTTFVPAWDGSGAPAASDVNYISVFLTDVNQNTSVGAKAAASGTSATLTTSTLATNDGDMVIDAATCSSSGTFTLNNSFNEAYEGGNSSYDIVDGNKAATGAAETPSVTHSSSTARKVLLGFVVKARPVRKLTVSASAGGTVSTPGIGDFNYPDGNNASIVASANANYHFVNWTGTAVTAGKVANPDSPDTTVLMDANYTVQANFAEGIHISGTITCGNLEVNDVNMTGLGVFTDVNGFYIATVENGWSGTVTPVKYGYTFDPNSRTYTSVTSDLTAQDYNALPADDFNDNRRGSMWRRSR